MLHVDCFQPTCSFRQKSFLEDAFFFLVTGIHIPFLGNFSCYDNNIPLIVKVEKARHLLSQPFLQLGCGYVT
jgi:hypothetical protein